MEYEEIVAVVRQASGGIGSEAADRALQATLQTLATRPTARIARAFLARIGVKTAAIAGVSMAHSSSC